MSKREQRRERGAGYRKLETNETPVLPIESAAHAIYGFPDAEEGDQGAITLYDDGSFQFGNFRLTPVGFEVPDGVDRDEWLELGRFLFRMEGAVQWLIGDLLITGDREWGVTYQEAADIFQKKVSTLYDYVYVASNVHFSVRTEKLDFGYHKKVASMTPENQTYWLQQAIDNGWSIAILASEIDKAQQGDRSSKASYLERFAKRYTSFGKQALRVAESAPKSQRRQMADMLRQLADNIESLK